MNFNIGQRDMIIFGYEYDWTQVDKQVRVKITKSTLIKLHHEDFINFVSDGVESSIMTMLLQYNKYINDIEFEIYVPGPSAVYNNRDTSAFRVESFYGELQEPKKESEEHTFCSIKTEFFGYFCKTFKNHFYSIDSDGAFKFVNKN